MPWSGSRRSGSCKTPSNVNKPKSSTYVRTTNVAERAFEEEQRRTKVIPHLWEEGSVTKLVFAVLIRVSER